MEQDNDGKIWIGSGSNIYCSDGDPMKLKRIKTSVSVGKINSFQFDDKGTGWIASNTGLFYFLNNGMDSIVLVRPDFFPEREEVEDVEYDGKGNLWIATKKNGLRIYFPSTGYLGCIEGGFFIIAWFDEQPYV
jgi:ligand-binding sensor domain-containing protein